MSKSGGLIRRILAYPFWKFVWEHRRRYAVGMLSLVLVDAINVALPLVVKEGIDALVPRNAPRVVWAGVLYFVLMAVQAIGRYLWRMYLIGTSHLIAKGLRNDLYAHLQRLPLGYYQRTRAGDLMSRATNDVESIRMAVGPGILVTADAILMFAMIIPVMFSLSFKLSVLAFCFYPAVPWLTARLGDRIDVLFESLQEKMSALGAYAQETFGGIRLVKSLVLESRVHARFLEMSGLYEKEGVKLAGYQALFTPALGLLTNLGTFLILLLGGRDVMMGAISIGTFVAFQRFVVQLSWPMEAIGWTVTMHREGVAAYRRLTEILSIPPVVSVRGEAPAAADGNGLDASLHVTRLSFQYPMLAGEMGAFRLELDDLVLRRGQKVGIVGPVASGKTTFFNLVLRIHEPPPGTIFWEGRDVTAIPLRDLRRGIGSVEQQIFLFSENIAANVALGSGGTVSRETIVDVARTAAILDEIEELDEGFEAPLRERGVNLSGGQRQRIALMRALARRPELLLLDDCFSAVDVAVEARIIDHFFDEYPDLTVLFASHRLSVMPRMDEIWMIDGGRVVARGRHAELLSREPLYQALWEKSERQVEVERFESQVLEEAK